MATTLAPLHGKESERVDPTEELRYPTTQGLARHGTWLHAHAVTQAYQALRRHFLARDDLFIAQTMCLYYRWHKVERCLMPDLFLAFDVAHKSRRVFKVWEEGGRVPDFVLEVSSVSTVHRDKGFKKNEYRKLGVREYWQLDTVGDLLASHLVGYRRVGRRFDQIGSSGLRGGRLEYRSGVLGLDLRAEPCDGGVKVVFRDPLTGEDIPTGDEVDRRLEESEGLRSAERAGRLRAEARADAAEERAKRAEERCRILESGV